MGADPDSDSRPPEIPSVGTRRHPPLAMLSLPHLIVIFVVALVIFGPEKLPELARMLGKATAEFRKMTGDFRYALEEEVRDLDRQARIRELNAAQASSQASSQAQPAQTQPE